MKSAKQRIEELNNIVRETELYFALKKKFFDDGQKFSDKQKMLIQEQKVKQMIFDSKKPIPSLR